MCGGTRDRMSPAPKPQGLSPRVRGNPPAVYQPYRFSRSIPACAGEPQLRFCPASSREVYPRVCGGTSPPSRWFNLLQGLSPRVRGNRRNCHVGRCPDRSIPACAGEPCPNDYSIPGRWVYPRVCGGTSPGDHVPNTCSGLSPRVRGNRAGPSIRSPCSRSIPACAGEPRDLARRATIVPVYPRVCGGTDSLSKVSFGLRSIPACAGEPMP